jgi:hypothetical protein
MDQDVFRCLFDLSRFSSASDFNFNFHFGFNHSEKMAFVASHFREMSNSELSGLSTSIFSDILSSRSEGSRLKTTIFDDFTKEMIESLSLLFDKLEAIDRNGSKFAIHFGFITTAFLTPESNSSLMENISKF